MTEHAGSYTVAPGRVEGTVSIAGAKSLVHRHIFLACLHGVDVCLENIPNSLDIEATVGSVRELGFTVDWNTTDATLRVAATKRRHVKKAHLHCGESGTTARLITALCAQLPGEWTLTGDGRLPQRPMDGVFVPLEQLGCTVDRSKKKGVIGVIHTPVTLNCDQVITIDTSTSSQNLSAMLLLSTSCRGLRLQTGNEIVSFSYVQMTIDACKHYGYEIIQNGSQLHAKKVHDSAPTSVYIEPDYSSLAYWVCAVVITKGNISIPNVSVKSSQADRRVLEFLQHVVEVTLHEQTIEICGTSSVTHVEGDCSDCPDLVPALAVTALFGTRSSHFRGIEHLRYKESDRISSVQQLVYTLGGSSSYEQGCLTVHPIANIPRGEVCIRTHNDHRIAMAGALAGLVTSGVSIDNAACVAKSYPEFWNHLELLTSTG